MTPAFSGVVLAGGRSSRMGRDKASLLYRGETLLNRAVALLHRTGASQVHVSGDRPAHAGIPDRWFECGPLAGVATVLPYCTTPRLVVVPVDMPELDGASLHGLLHALDDAPAACFRDEPLPWAARIDDALCNAVAHAVASPARGRSMRALHAAVGGVVVEPADPASLRNVNTPSDWAALP